MKNTIRILSVIIFILMSNACKQEKTFIQLPSIISNGMVLQQNTQVKLWGEASPNAKIKISASWGNTAETKADESGNWISTIQTPSGGEKYEIQFQTKDTILLINNVVLGEVWLASGQSNMEMPLKGWPPRDTILNAEIEIKNAHYPEIRMFTVERSNALTPQKDVIGSWKMADSADAADFSATAYFFARELHQKLGVPVGIIHSSWGGTPVESWISAEKLKSANEFLPELEAISEAIPLEQKLNNWMDSLPVLKLNDSIAENPFTEANFKDEACANPDFDDSQWPNMQLPTQWENTEIGHFDGNIWFRKELEIPENWINQTLVLELGPIDDMDVSFFNGTKIGEHLGDGFWQKKRKYLIDAELVKSTTAIIAVRVTDIQGGGGIYGHESELKIYPQTHAEQAISLAGEWKYLPTAEYRKNAFYLFDISEKAYYARPQVPIQASSHTPSCLFNAMIAPLVNYTIKGAIWYQGESNVGRAIQYNKIFPLMIENWREKWQLGDFPFYFAQIAPFLYESGTNSAPIREAQRLSLRVVNTGMAVTMDIGDLYCIHPTNKQAVGYRLALWALANTYQQNLVFSGPIFQQLSAENNQLKISFTHTGSGLTFKGKELTGFEIAGEDGIFHPAKAKIVNSEVWLEIGKVKNPVHVRYAFDNSGNGNLFNMEGLPASSFTSEKLMN